MKNLSAYTKAAIAIDIAAALALLAYIVIVITNNHDKYPTHPGYALILTPPLFGLLGMIPAVIGYIKCKNRLGITLIIISIIFLLWWYIFWFGGTLLFGP